jgi:hypothetical protein
LFVLGRELLPFFQRVGERLRRSIAGKPVLLAQGIGVRLDLCRCPDAGVE